MPRITTPAETQRRHELAAERKQRAGVRKNPAHSLRVRDRIKATQLVNRLTNFCLGKANGKDKCELSPHQVTAILGLLRKAIPDLQAIEHSGEVAQEVYMISAEPPTEAEWQEQYGGKRLDS